MSRLLDIDHGEGDLVVTFRYDPVCVEAVKSLPRRRYNPSNKAWRVPIEDLVVAVQVLEKLHFSFSPELRAYWNDHGFDARLEALEHERTQGLTVTELNRRVSRALNDAVPDEVWVCGEFSGFAPERHRSRHAFFELVETRGDEVCSKVRAVLFDSELRNIRRKLQIESGGSIELAEGIEARVLCRVELYIPTGSYQVRIVDFDVAYTTGKRKQARDRVLEQLASEGVVGDNRALRIPRLPLRVGLVTSYESDAYNDFLAELQKSPWAFEVTAADARVQGAQAEETVVEALNWFDARRERFDVIVVIRGGGSRSDLSAFDSYSIGKKVCTLGLKVICGIGHELDTSVLDLVSHSVKTPTAAASLLVERVNEVSNRLDVVRESLSKTARRRVADRSRDLGFLAASIGRSARVTVRTLDVELLGNVRRLSRELTRLTARVRRSFDQISERFDESAHRSIRASRTRVGRNQQRLDESRLMSLLDRQRARTDDARRRLRGHGMEPVAKQREHLDSFARQLSLADPARILDRGFSIVRKEGRLARFEEVGPGDTLSVEMSAGTVAVHVDHREESSDD